jgi:hypothetical protein
MLQFPGYLDRNSPLHMDLPSKNLNRKDKHLIRQKGTQESEKETRELIVVDSILSWENLKPWV